MLRQIKDSIINFITSRLFILILLFLCLTCVLLHRIFTLQIVNGEEYLNKFQLKINKDLVIPSTRGKIFDRNGNLLAYNELAYSVTIEDVYESSKTKNAEMNATIYKLIHMIEGNGDKLINDFSIVINSHGNFEFTAMSEKQQLRFLADIYGKADTTKLSYAEKTSTAKEVVEYLAGTKKYAIGEYTDPTDKTTFVVGKGYTNDELLKMIIVRYNLSLNTYQKYIATTVATDVSDETVVQIMENIADLEGVSIAETTIRKYVDSVYFSHILGYTGKISEDEYIALGEDKAGYTRNSVVGKAGIEQEMEANLKGKDGKKNVFINNLGKVIEVNSQVDPTAGNNLYLTIDKDLQKAIYSLLEQKIAGILIDKIENIKEYVQPENASASNIKIPIDDVYYALIKNSVINIKRFETEKAKDTEKAVYETFLVKQNQVIEQLKKELSSSPTAYKNLSKEYQVYVSYISTMLGENGVILTSEIDKDDEIYKAWKADEISLKEYLNQVIAKNWIDLSRFDLGSQYLDSDEIYNQLLLYIEEELRNDQDFSKTLYKYMIRDNQVTGKQICMLLYEQKIIDGTDEEKAALANGQVSPYHFMIERIRHLDITPAQLALDPCSGSIVVTDVNTGDVLALVTYPSYDNNRLANSIDAEYYAQLNKDLSRPLWDYATQQKSAPGSTFKMLSAIAALEEGYTNRNEQIICKGVWDVGFTQAKCWISPSSHGPLTIEGAIENSCNCYFYEMGYRMAKLDGNYNNETGLSTLAKYADMFGLSDKSGIEIVEESPKVSDSDSVRSAIGQGTNNYTTIGLSRYVTTVANRGTCYNLTLLDKVTNSNDELVEDYSAEVRNQVELATSTWDTVQNGMKKVVEGKDYFKEMNLQFAGKTGTAQERTTRANHALFVCYAPYSNPEISVTTRIAFGYASDYAAQVTGDVLKYYFKLENEAELLDGTATETDGNVSREN